MLDAMSGSDLINELAHEFAERYRRGERPPLREYAERHPELADEIRELFPTLVMMEQLGSGVDHASGTTGRRERSSEPIPERLGDYRILREVGRGGMGIVYEAVQESLGRHVALKVLSQHRQFGAVQLLRFEREAKAAALLHHTNIVPVFGVGEHEGLNYYAMQYIEGQSLDSVLAEIIKIRHNLGRSQGEPAGISVSLAEGLFTRGLPALRTPTEMRRSDAHQTEPSPGSGASSAEGREGASGSSTTSRILGSSESHYFRSVARLGMQVAEALGYAHLHGVYHRDIKPANLLLDMGGTVWVTDFGLAKKKGADELTSPGDIVGTLRYMAPERFRGVADASSDIYSLGLTLYEMLTFAPAFLATHRVEYIHAILHQEPRRPRSVDPRVPLDLETIVLRAISKNPADRFATADEMARELGRFVEGRPILSRRVWLHERVWRWSRRNPAVAALLLLAASLTSILAVGSTVAAWKYREQRDAIRVEQTRTRASLDRVTEAERDQKAELGRSLLVQARAVRYSGQPGRRDDALETLEHAAQIAHAVGAPSSHLAELRDELIAVLALADDHPAQAWSELPSFDTRKAYSVVGDRYVDVGRDGLIHVYRLSDRSKLKVLAAEEPVRRLWPMMVPGGRFLLIDVADVNSCWELWDLERGVRPDAWPADVRGVSVRPDGSRAAALRSTGELVVFDLPSLNRRSSCRLGFEVRSLFQIDWMSFSQRGRQLALIHPDEKVVWVVDVESGRVVREVKIPTCRVDKSVALNRTEGLLAIAHDRAISVFDMADGEQLSLLQAHQSEGILARFQPGGDLLASSSWDGTTRLWDPIRGRLVVTLEGAFREWLDGGSSMVTGWGRELAVHKIAAGKERRAIDCRMLGDAAGATLFGPARISYSPDGQLLAMAVRPEGVRIARTSDGAALAFLPIGECDEVLFMPNGDLLTFNDRGLCRWPIGRAEGATLSLGPPEPVALIGKDAFRLNTGLAVSADGRLIGASSVLDRGLILLEVDRPWRKTVLAPHAAVVDVAISADGRWVCTGSRGGGVDRHRVKVWDVSTGEIVAQLPLGNARVAFSPDSRWLGVGGEAAYRFFSTGSWKAGPVIEFGGRNAETPLAFHPGSRVAALLDSSRSVVQIVDVETGDIAARLDAPEQSTVYHLTFSPDGRYLAVAHSDQRVDLWDLSSIRRRLESLGLAAGIPDIFGNEGLERKQMPIPGIDVRGADAFGLRILAIRHVLSRAWFNCRSFLEPGLADPEALRLRAIMLHRLGHWPLAEADFRASLSRRGESAATANDLAWLLASVPGRGNPEEALVWARKAVNLDAELPAYRNTLGTALYRAGRYAEAVAVFERNIPLNRPDHGYDLVFLAMCKLRLGQRAAAREAMSGARAWRSRLTRMSSWQSAQFESYVHEFEAMAAESVPDLPEELFAR
jgi:serine/threonine protein kinase/WD40 repeat protein/Tfp pilus assembly protein PilF